METNYNGTLVMPANYAVVDNDEMMYVDGGWCIERCWWGANVYLTHSETSNLINWGTIPSHIKVPGYEWVTVINNMYSHLFSRKDNGHGIRIRVTGILANPVVTGAFTLSASEERNIAASNRIL